MGFCLSFVSLLPYYYVFFISLVPQIAQSQTPRENISSINGYTCPSQTQTRCQTMAFYRAQPPPYGNLSSISDLFGVSMLSIKRSSNLSDEMSPLIEGQKLLIPINCGCMGNLSQANITYQIQAGDTFYIVSTYYFANLTTYQAVEVANPSFIPTRLEIGDMIVFPIRCRCPTVGQLQSGIHFLITYVVGMGDTASSIATMFNSSVKDINSVNGLGDGSKIEPFSTLLVPVLRIPEFSQPIPQYPPPPSYQIKIERKDSLVVSLSVVVGVLGFLWVLVVGFIFVYLARRKTNEESKIKGGDYTGLSPYEGEGRFVPFDQKTSSTGIFADISQCLDKYTVYTLHELQLATNHFDPKSVIQGHVYKATISGKVFAVKKMKSDVSEQLRILQKVNHANLVGLDGFCVDDPQGDCYLVYEYVENGPLYSWLRYGLPLDWKTRIRIALDVANGLSYIHEHTQPTVVHKDVTSNNILLDKCMRAKIANFVLARSGCNAITRNLVGSQGYVAPEYVIDGVVSPKIDVFAFGVVLLELISGRPAVEDGKFLWVEFEKLIEDCPVDREGMVKKWMDVSVLKYGGCSIESVVGVIAIAEACLHKEASKRPSIAETVYMLSKCEEFSLDVSVVVLGDPAGVAAR